MNPWTRQAALCAIAAIAIAASANALAHSYAGLYAWAVHHELTGWQAMSWPAEIDVFLAVGELALYVAYLDGWPARQRVWPWVTAVVGLAVSVAGNIGHIQPLPGHPVVVADRLTAATSPLAAFAGLTVGLLVLRMNRQQTAASARECGRVRLSLASDTAGRQNGHHAAEPVSVMAPGSAAVEYTDQRSDANSGAARPRDPGPPVYPDPGLLQAAQAMSQTAAARGERLSQRALARQLRGHGHRFPNQHLRGIAGAIGLEATRQQARTQGG